MKTLWGLMANFYSISVMHDYAFILYLEKKNNDIVVLSSETVEHDKLEEFCKDKNNIYLSVEQEFEYSIILSIPVAIANSRNVKNYILYKIQEANQNVDVLFNYKKFPKQNDEKNIDYGIEALDENRYLDALKFVGHYSKIKSSTTKKFALLSIANKCIDNDYYICVYTYANTILILAVEQKELIFSRSATIDSQTPETMQIEIAENITHTISYIYNEFRDIAFTTLILSGSIALDDVIPQHIAMFNDLNIAILYPNTFVKNLNADESQEYILPLGTALIEKDDQFIPKKILGFRQFDSITAVTILLSFIILIATSYFTFVAYENYADLTQKNQLLKQKYLHAISQAKMLPKRELENYEYTIDMTKKYLKDSPADVIIQLKPLVSLLKPSKFKYTNEKGNILFTLSFEKQFDALVNLYKFEKEFDTKFNALKDKLKITKKMTVDYKKLLYKVDISTQKNKVAMHKRRRRVQ